MAKIPKIMRSYRFTKKTLQEIEKLADILETSHAEAIAWAVSAACQCFLTLNREDLEN